MSLHPERTGANVPMSAFPDGISVEPVNVVAADGASRKAMLYQPAGRPARTALHLMHPKMDQSQNYLVPHLLRAGYAVLAGGSRWVHNDIATVHEKLVLDVAAGLLLLRQRGFANVVLVGNSGGGTLAALYQSQAGRPGQRLTETPAGDRIDLDAHDLPSADGLAVIGGHPGEAEVLRHWIDPSVVTEGDPEAVDPKLDMYAEENGFRRPPEHSTYTADFLDRYRAAQLQRVLRIDDLARGVIERRAGARQRLGAGAEGAELTALERAAGLGTILTVYRTEADPTFLDLSHDPDDRPLGAPHDLRPDLANYGSSGFARVVTPQAWLSTWSATSTNADTARCLADVHVPLLVVHYAGDAFTKRSQIRSIFDGAGSTDKVLHDVAKVDHYGFEIIDDRRRGERTAEGPSHLVAWLEERYRP